MARLFTRIFARPATKAEPQPEPAERSATPAAPVATPPAEAALPLLGTLRWGPAKGPGVENIVFLCHGMGSSAEGIIQIAPQLATLLQTSLFVAPDGPEHAPASDGRLWFDARNRSPTALETGVRGAAVRLDALIDSELDQAGLGRDAYALVGYSQGAMTVLFTGLRRTPPPRAILSYAGALLAPDSLEREMTGRVPVMLVHGIEDPVVPAFYSRDAEKALRGLGVPVQTVYPPRLGHTIDGSVVQAGKQFLARSLAGVAAHTQPARPSRGG
ncbi:MAG: alpha/beta hydrolase [Acetobacteraceae bacterium]